MRSTTTAAFGALAATVATVGAAMVGLAPGATAAGALSCAPNEAATPQAIAAGAPVFAEGTVFFDHYDFAVLGTVVAIRTDERPGSPTYGATEVDVQVDGVLGVGSAPEQLTLRAADPGWMSGYPFAVGQAYFVPVLAEGPDGQVNWTFLCDPIAELDDPAATVTELRPLAIAAGDAFGEPGGSEPPAASGGGDGLGWFVPVVTATAVLAAAATAVVLLRRRPQLLAR